jgi:pimeloyl-ACP methyl ester carboxylesterase
VARTTAERAWVVFRFGPTYGTPFPGVQFPVDSMLSFGSQGVPGTDSFLVPGGVLQQAPAALAALLDKIGPAIVFVHSQSGPFADALVALRPNLVSAVVNVEGSQDPAPTDAQIAAYRNVPDLELFGDRTDLDVSTGKPRYDARKLVAQRINAAGGNATILTLPEAGLHGNTHMMMQDKNNLQVADVILRWIDANVGKKVAKK